MKLPRFTAQASVYARRIPFTMLVLDVCRARDYAVTGTSMTCAKSFLDWQRASSGSS
jgi:hypothetical protein